MRLEGACDPFARPARGLASQEEDLDSVEEVGLEGVETRSEETNALPLAEWTEERETTDCETGRQGRRRLVEHYGLPRVLDDASGARHVPASLAHPFEEPLARTDDGVGKFDCRPFGDFLAEARQSVGELGRGLGQPSAGPMA